MIVSGFVGFKSASIKIERVQTMSGRSEEENNVMTGGAYRTKQNRTENGQKVPANDFIHIS